MNIAVIMGRLTADPNVRYVTDKDGNQMCIASYSLAVDRIGRDAGADFINFTAFRKNGEFAEKYLRKGTKVVVEGHITTGSYTDKDGKKIYTTSVTVDRQEFAESKKAAESNEQIPPAQPQSDSDGFMNIPDGIDEELPFT